MGGEGGSTANAGTAATSRRNKKKDSGRKLSPRKTLRVMLQRFVPAEPVALFFSHFFQQRQGPRALVVGAGYHDDVKQRHGGYVRRGERRRIHRGEKTLVRKLHDRRNQGG